MAPLAASVRRASGPSPAMLPAPRPLTYSHTTFRYQVRLAIPYYTGHSGPSLMVPAKRITAGSVAAKVVHVRLIPEAR